MYQVPGAVQQAVNVHGLRIAYRKAGAGPPVVLLHGLAYSWLTWAANIPALAQHSAVYAPDLPGHGDSDRPALFYGFELGVKLLRRFVDRLDLSQITLVGHSLGGALALKFALANPSRVTRLVLVDAAGLGERTSLFFRLMAVPGVRELVLSGKLITVGGMRKRLFLRPERVGPGLSKALHHARTAQLNRSIAREMIGAGLEELPDQAPRLAELQMPVLVVWGEGDRLLPVAHARDLARRYPHIPVRILPDVGHWPHMEAAEAFNELLVQFIASGEGTPAS